MQLSWQAADANLDPATLKLEYYQPGSQGWDVVEVAPQYDPTTNTVQLAAQLLFEEFALMTCGRDVPAGSSRMTPAGMVPG